MRDPLHLYRPAWFDGEVVHAAHFAYRAPAAGAAGRPAASGVAR
jgi:hypothetical protein